MPAIREVVKSSEATPGAGGPPPAAGRADRLRVALVGTNAWLVCGVVPVFLAAGRPAAAVVALGLAPAALAGGLFAQGRPGGESVAGWLLLALFPALLALGLALPAGLHAADALSPGVAVVAAVAFVGYGAVAASAVARPGATRPGARHPLTATPRVAEERARVWLRRGMIAVVAGGGLLLAAAAPFWRAGELSRTFPGATSEAATLAALVGGVLATVLSAVLLGPGLRASRVARPPAGRAVALRVLALAAVAALGIVATVLWRRAQ